MDLLGHREIGGKTLLFIIDGLRGAPGVLEAPEKWNMNPFDAIAEGTTTLGLEVDQLVDGDTNTIGTACGNDGSVTVGTGMLGDVNGDGVIDIIDALLVAQYYVGLIADFC